MQKNLIYIQFLCYTNFSISGADPEQHSNENDPYFDHAEGV